MQHFAKSLIAYETSQNKSSETKSPTTCIVNERLRLPLTTLMGNVGFRTLLCRAHVLTSVEYPWLNAVNIKADGSFEGLEELEARGGAEEITKGCIALIAKLFELLVVFIGENLIMQLVREVWPKFPSPPPKKIDIKR